MRFLFGILGVFAASSLSAECVPKENVLISDCAGPLRVQLVKADNFGPLGTDALAVTGTYSSGDRLGIEGLAVLNGSIESRRLQSWDGVLILSPSGKPSIFNARDVTFGGAAYNIKDPDAATQLLEAVAAHGSSMIQSHLLISNGVLDLRDVANAPVFYRRLFYVRHDGEFGVWQPPERLSLYDAAVQLQDELQPKMALNLDMGAYDFCQFGDGRDCGRLTVTFDRLTNILVFTPQDDERS